VIILGSKIPYFFIVYILELGFYPLLHLFVLFGLHIVLGTYKKAQIHLRAILLYAHMFVTCSHQLQIHVNCFRLLLNFASCHLDKKI